MNRRKFVKNSSQASLALALLGLASCKNSTSEKTKETTLATLETPPFFKLSLAQWSLHRMIKEGQISPYDFAKKAKDLGFEGLEYVSQLYTNELNGFDNELEGIETMVRKLKQQSDEHNLTNLIMMVDLPGETGALCHPDAAIRKKAITDHHKWIDATAGLGCHSTRINLFGTRDRNEWKSYATESLMTLCEYAQKQDVNVIVENHGWLSSDAALLAAVMKAVNMDNCGTLPDFGNFCVKRDGEGNWDGKCIEEYDRYKGTEELMPFAKGVSAKSHDFDAQGEETATDYKKMLSIVKASGYTGFIGVEYEGSRLSEEEGILATKKLLIETAKKLS